MLAELCLKCKFMDFQPFCPSTDLFVDEPAFTADNGKFEVHTRWIETEWNNPLQPWTGQQQDLPVAPALREVILEIEGKRVTVAVPRYLITGEAERLPSLHRRKRGTQAASHTGAKGNSLLAPMQRDCRENCG